VISKVEFEAKQKAVSPYAGGGNTFTFTVTPDDLDGVYYDGEYMSMRLYSARDCYFRIVHVDVNGTAQVIYPLAAGDNNFIRAGETRRIPERPVPNRDPAARPLSKLTARILAPRHRAQRKPGRRSSRSFDFAFAVKKNPSIF
jgi:hypothetical protein